MGIRKFLLLLLVVCVPCGCQDASTLPPCASDALDEIRTCHLDTRLDPVIPPSGAGVPEPATVDTPERQVRYLSLAEAIALALENGTVGNDLLNGTVQDLGVDFRPTLLFARERSIRVLAIDPAAVATDIEASLSRFDVRWVTSMVWSNTDRPPSPVVLPEEPEAIPEGPTVFQSQQATFSTGLIKPLPTGGVAAITFRTDYQDISQTTDPTYAPRLQFQFEQPLLQGFGVEINQLRQTHPGSLLTPFTILDGREGILITRLRFDEQRAEFERQVHVLLANVEIAYWRLYAAYGNLYSRDQAVRLAYESWRISEQRYRAGQTPSQDLAHTRQQYEQFRGLRLQAVADVLDREHQLRALTGMAIADGTRLVPLDPPTLAPLKPHWVTSLNESLATRPELIEIRQEVKFRQFDLIRTNNTLLPDLRFFSTYDLHGIGTRLDGGPDPLNALHSLATDKFNDWSFGLRLDVPIGFRDANANVRAAKLRLAQSLLALHEEEERATRLLAAEFQAVDSTYQQIRAQRARREAAGNRLQSLFQIFLAGAGTLDFLLQAEFDWSDAFTAEYAAIAEYNNAITRFEFARGTIMADDNVSISEGPLPVCAQMRAVEHERERTRALLVRERQQYDTANHGEPAPFMSQIPPEPVLSLPQAFGTEAPPLSDETEKWKDEIAGAPRDAIVPAPGAVDLTRTSPSGGDSPPPTTMGPELAPAPQLAAPSLLSKVMPESTPQIQQVSTKILLPAAADETKETPQRARITAVEIRPTSYHARITGVQPTMLMPQRGIIAVDPSANSSPEAPPGSP